MATQWAHRVPLKATSSINFSTGRLALGADNAEAKEILKQLTSSRAALLDALGSSATTLDMMNKATQQYLALLRGLIEHVVQAPPPPPVAAPGAAAAAAAPQAPATTETAKSDRLRVGVVYRWRDNVSGRVDSVADSKFELASMLLNVSIWMMSRATALAMASPDEDVAKDIFKSLRSAAGILQFVVKAQSQFVSYSPNTDLDERIMRAQMFEALAEAQEVTIERARQKNHQASLIASLAHDTMLSFQAAAKELESVPGTTSSFKLYLEFKTAFYEAYSNTYAGQDAFKEEKCGVSLKYYDQAQAALARAAELAKAHASAGVSTFAYRTSAASLVNHTIYKTLAATLAKFAEKSKSENGFIYFHKVPAEAQPLPEPKKLTQAENFELPAASDLWMKAIFDSKKIPQVGQSLAADKAAADDIGPLKEPGQPDKAGRAGQAMSDELHCVIS